MRMHLIKIGIVWGNGLLSNWLSHYQDHWRIYTLLVPNCLTTWWMATNSWALGDFYGWTRRHWISYFWHNFCGMKSKCWTVHSWRYCRGLWRLIPARYTIIYRFLCELYAFLFVSVLKPNQHIYAYMWICFCLCPCLYTHTHMHTHTHTHTHTHIYIYLYIYIYIYMCVCVCVYAEAMDMSMTFWPMGPLGVFMISQAIAVIL